LQIKSGAPANSAILVGRGLLIVEDNPALVRCVNKSSERAYRRSIRHRRNDASDVLSSFRSHRLLRILNFTDNYTLSGQKIKITNQFAVENAKLTTN